MKNYTYNKAMKVKGLHQVVVPSTTLSTCQSLENLARLSLKIPTRKFNILPEDTTQANIIRLAQFFNYDINDAVKFYNDKAKEYMTKEYGFIQGSVLYRTNSAKQFGIDETYKMLQRYIFLEN